MKFLSLAVTGKYQRISQLMLAFSLELLCSALVGGCWAYAVCLFVFLKHRSDQFADQSELSSAAGPGLVNVGRIIGGGGSGLGFITTWLAAVAVGGLLP